MESANWTSVYEPLRSHLFDRDEVVVRMTFTDVESVLGRRLPMSARTYPAWWANEKIATHAHPRAWLDTGRQTRSLDFSAESVEFSL
jgi:hypothetical protein